MREATVLSRAVRESKLGIEEKLNNTTNSISGKILSLYKVEPKTNKAYDAIRMFFGEQEAVYTVLGDKLPAGPDASSFRFLYSSYIAVDKALNSFRPLSPHNSIEKEAGGNGLFRGCSIDFFQVYPRTQDEMIGVFSGVLTTKQGCDLELLTKNYFEWVKQEVDKVKSSAKWEPYRKYINDLAIKFEGETRIYTGFCTASYAPPTKEKGGLDRLSFDDIGGYEDVKEQLRELIFCIQNKEKMINYMPENLLLPKGVLLIGPPGTGKTFFAQVFSHEAGVPFISFGVEDIGSEYQYKTSQKLEEKFKEAAYFVQEGGHKACVVFIDEIEAITATRYDSRDNNDAAKVVNTFNVYMDGGKATPGVMIFAATNREDVMDPAILREGRFSKKIYIGYPNDAELTSIFLVYVNKYNNYLKNQQSNNHPPRKQPIFGEIDYDRLVKYCSNSEIIEKVREKSREKSREDGIYFSEKGITGAVINENFAEMVRSHVRNCLMNNSPVTQLSTDHILKYFRKYRQL